jgi:hypothetical protein
MAKIKVELDTSAIDALAKLSCYAGCKNNTSQRSGGGSSGHCDYKHVSIGDGGQCTMFVAVKSEERTD